MTKYDFSKLTRKIKLVKFFDDVTGLHSESDQDASELIERERELAPTAEEWAAYRAEKQDTQIQTEF